MLQKCVDISRVCQKAEEKFHLILWQCEYTSSIWELFFQTFGFLVASSIWELFFQTFGFLVARQKGTRSLIGSSSSIHFRGEVSVFMACWGVHYFMVFVG